MHICMQETCPPPTASNLCLFIEQHMNNTTWVLPSPQELQVDGLGT